VDAYKAANARLAADMEARERMLKDDVQCARLEVGRQEGLVQEARD